MRWFSHPHLGTRFLRYALVLFALGCVAVGYGLARLEWHVGDSALLALVPAALGLPVALAVMLLWIVLDVLERDGREAKFRDILLTSAIALCSAAACIGSFFATRWASARWAVWRLDVESKPVVDAIERSRARNGHAPRSLEELVPSELDRLPARLAGCNFWFTPLDGEFDPVIGWYDLGPADAKSTARPRPGVGLADRAVLVAEIDARGTVCALRVERALPSAVGSFDAERWREGPSGRREVADALADQGRLWHGHRRLLEELLGTFDGTTRPRASAWELQVRRPAGYRELFRNRPLQDYDDLSELDDFRRMGDWVFGIDSDS